MHNAPDAGPGYAELHAHSCFSLLDGASFPEELVDEAVRLGLPALALTDHDNLHAALDFANSANAAGLQPITGAELTLADGSHLTLLVESASGYRTLCRLITTAHYAGERPMAALPIEALAQQPEGLILLTGCRHSELCRRVDTQDITGARRLLRQFQTWFGPENVYVELQRNLVRGDRRRTARLAALAAEAGAGIVATGNVHYHRPERVALQDTLVAIRHRTSLDGAAHLRRINGEWYLVDAGAMHRRFRLYPEALANTLVIAERCRAFNLARNLEYRFPDYPVTEGDTPDERLARVTRQLLAERYGNDPKATARLEEELALIRRHELAGFFLTYADIMRLASEVADEVRGQSLARRAGNMPPGRGRGSSVSSIVCYLLGLSHVDPVQHDLFLGRFLHEDLTDVPDIDLDFPRDIRAALIERLYAAYPERVGLVCTYATYRMRSAIRDVGKALGLPPQVLDRLAKLGEHGNATAVREHLARTPDVPHPDSPLWSHLADLAQQISGMPRHVGQHSGGMVVASQPLTELVPMQPAAMEGRHLIQWDKDTCGDARFVKIDILGLGMLSAVEECLDLIAGQGKELVDLSRIDFRDPAVFAMIQRGDTVGTFQIESRAQIQTLLKTKPETLEDLVVQVAIVRPGPIVGGATRPWIRAREQYRLTGRPEITYDHPLLEDALEETYGVILYQEQILQVAMALANFTPGQADRLRRAMSRKRSLGAITALWEEFRDGALANDVPEEVAHTVFEKITGFAAYGFPKAHSVSFAVLAYQSCWLRHYYPAEFTCAVLNEQPMGFYPAHTLIGDAKRLGLRVLPVDVNASAARCAVAGHAIRIGLGYVKGIRVEEAQAIEQGRHADGPYRSLGDLLRRVEVRREIVERLIMVGAFDWTGLRRRELLWQFGLLQPALRLNGPGATSVQQLGLELPIEQDMVALPPLSVWDKLRADYDILGLSAHWHPLLLLRPQFAGNVLTAAQIAETLHGEQVTTAGLVVCRQRPGTAKGVTFVLLEDETGLTNIVVHQRLYERERLTLRTSPVLLIEGRLERQGDAVNIVAQRFTPIPIEPPAAQDADTATRKQPQLVVASHDYR
jgi:error-prone DNA polymerase